MKIERKRIWKWFEDNKIELTATQHDNFRELINTVINDMTDRKLDEVRVLQAKLEKYKKRIRVLTK